MLTLLVLGTAASLIVALCMCCPIVSPALQQAVCKVFESFDHASAGLVSVLDFKRGLQFLGVHRVHTPEVHTHTHTHLGRRLAKLHT